MRRGAGYIRYLGHTWDMMPVPRACTDWKKLKLPRLFLSCVSCREPLTGSVVWVTTNARGITRKKLYTCTTCIPE